MCAQVSHPADPNRCQGVTATGQCLGVRVTGTEYCELHGGGRKLLNQEQMYLLTEAYHQQRLTELTEEHDPVEALQEVLALVRLLLTKRLNLTKFNAAELSSAYGPVNALQLTVERIQRSLNTIEQNLKVFLSKTTVLSVGRLTIQIAAEELDGIQDYEGTLLRITQQVNDCIETANNQLVQRGAPKKLHKANRKRLFMLKNAEDQAKLTQLREHPRAKSLRDDIALNVLLITSRLDAIKDEDLVHQATGLNQQLRTLEKLIRSAHDIEQIVGTLLSRETTHQIGHTISEILADELAHLPNQEDLADKIMNRLIATLADKEAAQPRLLGTHPNKSMSNG